MRYLCLICYDEKKHAALSRAEAEVLRAQDPRSFEAYLQDYFAEA